MKRAVIIGGGIAGLSAAYYLKRKGVEITLIEKKNTVGGAIRTDLKNERYLLELGPNTFLSSSKAISALSQELGITQQAVTNIRASKKRYIWRKNKLNPLPIGPREFLRSPIMSLCGKIRLLLEPLIKSRSRTGETLAAFVMRRAGRELLDALVDPFVSGVWAGDPFQLEIKSVFPRIVEIENEFGSVLKGARHMKAEFGSHDLMSFRWGMETLPARLFDVMKKDIMTDANVDSITRMPDYKWRVEIDSNHQPIEADALVISTPAMEAARLLLPHAPDIFSPMMNIPYVSLVVVHTAYKEWDVPILEGFGFLIPRSEKIRLLGSIWSSSLFPNRVPTGEVLFTNFIGGATDPDAIELSDHELLSHVMMCLEQTLGLKAEPCFYNIKRINQAIPQYTTGHSERLIAIENCLKRLNGVFLTGSYFEGISVSDTIEHARKTASSAIDFLNKAL